jgi:23S rRNA pseudouridine1911/1915/1917 synthase
MQHRLLVPNSAAGTRLDVWIEGALEGCSRSLVAKCIKDDCFVISAGKAKPGYKLRGGEQIDIDVPDLIVTEIEPENPPLEVLYEDDELLIVNKAPGMVVHPAVGHRHGTLLAGVLHRYGQGGDDPQAAALIHRLDADTSGVIAIARTPQAHAWYQDQFRKRCVVKQYLALLAGQAKSDWWSIDNYIGRHPKDFRMRAVVDAAARGARNAHSDFYVCQRLEHAMAAEVRIHTGRTHQIRVHAASCGHAVLADGLYGRCDRWPLQGEAVLQRQGLHAWCLQLRHSSGKTLRVEAPVPADIAALLNGAVKPREIVIGS